MTRYLLAGALALTCWSVAPTAEAQPRAGLTLMTGFGGSADFEYDNPIFPSTEFDLEPTLGFALRGEYVLFDYFAVGAFMEFLSFNPDGLGDEREETLGFGGLLKVRYPLEIAGYKLTPYVSLPIGGTVWFRENEDNWRGLRSGLLTGAEVELGPFAIFLELGWRFHKLWGNELDVSAHQFAFNTGASFIFGN